MLIHSVRSVAAVLAVTAALATPALAATPKDTLTIVSEQGPNSLDTMVPTANDHSRMVVWQIYDRLVSNGEKKLADGTVSYDAKIVTPELAERWDISPDGHSIAT
jgi:peptide/nickel transport system substrate-binding protein